MTGDSRSTRPGTVFWITGLAGSGKTTIAKLLHGRLRELHPGSALLDGDELREAFEHDLGYSLEDRRRCARRYCRLSRLLSAQGIHVVVATISLFHEVHDWNRRNMPRYCEIFVRSPRPPSRPEGNQPNPTPSNVVGLDLPAEEPRWADLVVDNDGTREAALIADWIWERVERWLG